MSEPSIPLQALDAELQKQLQSSLPGPVLARLRDSLSLTQQRLERLERENQLLRALRRLALLDRYGPAGERLSDAQLELLEVEPGVSRAEVAAEGERGPVPSALKKERSHPGRQELPPHLPRVEKLIACTPEQCVCAQCGQATTVIGYEQSEQLEVAPAKYFVVVTKREKRACKGCEEQGVACAPLPPRIIEKGLASDRVVIDTVVRKYAEHLPLYRQSVILERDTGVAISRATMDGWVMEVGEVLRPIAEKAMRAELLQGCYLQADETPVHVQMHDGRGKNHSAFLWQYSCPNSSAVFDFRMSRDRRGPKQFLDKFAGRLQSDGYGAYDRVGGEGLVHVACWAHARRKFFDAVKLNASDQSSMRIVAQLDALFRIDAQAREGNLSQEARHVLRLEKAAPLLEQIKTSLQEAKAGALPQSALAKACQYTLTLWARLTRFLEYPEVELSTNLAENSMRPIALGRKNWIHLGSERAGPRVAAILSVVETCRRLEIPLRAYLGAVLPGLANFPMRRIAELTPLAWRAANRQA